MDYIKNCIISTHHCGSAIMENESSASSRDLEISTSLIHRQVPHRPECGR